MTGNESSGGYRAMTLAEAVRAVNGAGFTLNIERECPEPGKVGWFRAGDGLYEVVNTVDGLDGYVVHGTAGAVAAGELKSADEVKEALSDREPESGREYVDIGRRLHTDRHQEEGWVEPRLTGEEARLLDKLLKRLQEERNAQFGLQGMSNEPASYESLIRNGQRRYLRERYLETEGSEEGEDER